MRIPTVKRRRYYDRNPSRGLRDYMESDNNYVENNMRACVWFLDNRDKLNEILKGLPPRP